MYVETDLDPNSRKTHRKSLKSMDNRSKKSHCHIVQQILDYNSFVPVIRASNVLYPIRNNFPSIADVTMDFSTATV